MSKPYFCRNFYSQIDVTNVSKIKQTYCYFTENTSMDFWKVYYNPKFFLISLGCGVYNSFQLSEMASRINDRTKII